MPPLTKEELSVIEDAAAILASCTRSLCGVEGALLEWDETDLAGRVWSCTRSLTVLERLFGEWLDDEELCLEQSLELLRSRRDDG